MTVIPERYEGSGKREKVESMFNTIAPHYDRLNIILSAGIDRIWRRKAISLLKASKPKYILDIATGTADLAIAASRLHPDKITGVDISPNMLEIGREKISERNLSGLITLQLADSEDLPFADHTFDAITVAFGVRNFEHLKQGLNEMYRVLKPGGKVIILEFSQPEKFPVKQLYNFYSKYILPFVAQLISRQRAAYEYLPASVNAFPYGNRFLGILKECNFTHTKCYTQTFGIASIYTAIR